MSYVIFGDLFTFPDGNAATNRVHTYAKGFYENDLSVHVVCFASEYNSSGDGSTNGIIYHHPFGQRKRSKYFIVRRWHKFLKYFRTISLFRRINREDRIKGIIVYSILFNTHMFAWILSKITKSKLLKECGEHPLRMYQKGAMKKLQGLVKLKIESNFCDGILCISQFLIDFHLSHGIPLKKLFHVPSTVDTDRFIISNGSKLPYQYILYVGSLTIQKDGVNILVESFNKILQKYPDINLVLIGKGDTVEEEKFIKDLVVNLNITHKVIFMGQIHRSEIPVYMVNAKILALARPKSLVADAGFPSKLTEYLAAGVPVVVTEVGDIPVYLKENKNAFLALPGSIDSFAEKLDYVLGNYSFARQIGLNGKILTSTVFNYKYQAKRIAGFVEN